jgi:hypothetical protein
MSFVPLTLAHYPETRIRNYLVPWNLHASMAGFLAFDSGFTSLTPNRKISSDVWPQLIHSHSVDCTSVPWESLTSNQVVSTMFDFNTCNHMVRFILSGDGIEYPGTHLFGPGCDGICIICWHIDPLCMSRGYVVSIWIFLHRSTVYSWWLCDLLTAWIHNVWLVAMN